MKYLRALSAVLAVAALCYMQFLDAAIPVRDIRADAASGSSQHGAQVLRAVI